MTPRPDVSAERRDQILDTAEDVFAQRGFDEARMDDIAEHSGLSKGAIYWYFKKKDDIIAALLDRVFRRSIDSMRAAAARPIAVLDRLALIGEQTSRDFESMSRLMPIALEFYSVALRQKKVRRHLAEMYDEMLAILVPLIEEGVRSGELDDVDPRQAATLLLATYEGLGLVWAISPKTVDWKTLGPQAALMLCSGLKKRGPERKGKR
ncbi:MAG TPA: TetR/AcrR family transcriptional regulator [Acidobacteriaceae bacterium]|jgi:AcrR family transcriptional regulator|nr:TetR/AcrR family transcriptional regulator [Acidobacteriaceae bacterium]